MRGNCASSLTSPSSCAPSRAGAGDGRSIPASAAFLRRREIRALAYCRYQTGLSRDASTTLAKSKSICASALRVSLVKRTARKSVGLGKSVSVLVDLVGRRFLKKKKQNKK